MLLLQVQISLRDAVLRPEAPTVANGLEGNLTSSSLPGTPFSAGRIPLFGRLLNPTQPLSGGFKAQSLVPAV